MVKFVSYLLIPRVITNSVLYLLFFKSIQSAEKQFYIWHIFQTEYQYLNDSWSPKCWWPVFPASMVSMCYSYNLFWCTSYQDQAWLLYLDEDWRKILSLLTEMLHQTSGITITTRTPDTEAKVEVALLEIARRFSFTEDVVIVSNDDQIRCWFEWVVSLCVCVCVCACVCVWKCVCVCVCEFFSGYSLAVFCFFQI